MKTSAEKLKELREEKNMSQAECARAMGLDRTTYVKYENGGSIRRNVEKLAKFFNVTTDYLLGNSDDPTPRDSAASRQPAAHSDSDAPSTPRLSERAEQHAHLYDALSDNGKYLVDVQTQAIYKQENEKGTAAHTKDGDGMTTAEESSQHTAS